MSFEWLPFNYTEKMDFICSSFGWVSFISTWVLPHTVLIEFVGKRTSWAQVAHRHEFMVAYVIEKVLKFNTSFFCHQSVIVRTIFVCMLFKFQLIVRQTLLNFLRIQYREISRNSRLYFVFAVTNVLFLKHPV